jgi:hypothetical protein
LLRNTTHQLQRNQRNLKSSKCSKTHCEKHYVMRLVLSITLIMLTVCLQSQSTSCSFRYSSEGTTSWEDWKALPR